MKIRILLFCFLSLSSFVYAQTDIGNLEILPENIQDALDKREKTLGKNLPPEIEKLVSSSVVEKSKIWNEGVLKVSFKGGNSTLHRKIAETANIWTNYGDITLDFGYNPIKRTFRVWKPNDTSHIRVGFEYKGYWSIVGNTSVDWSIIPKGQISLNLQNFDNGNLPVNWKATVLHEFGHALGFKHEHQSPDSECDFDWPKVYSELAKKPNQWNKEKVNHNIRKLRERGLTFSKYDNKSIMHYNLPSWMFKTGEKSECYTEKNLKLSVLDKKMMNKIYPLEDSDFKSQREKISVVYENIKIAYEKSDSISTTSNTVAYKIFKKKADYFSKERNENSKYIVGIQGLNVNEKKYSRFAQFIKNKGYTINLNSNYKENRPWLAKVSIVLYYNRKNKNKAREIALELSKITGQKFDIGIGKGLAVFDP